MAVCAAMAWAATPAVAATSSIDGDPLNVVVDDQGRLQVAVEGASTGEFYYPDPNAPANAGFTLVVDSGGVQQSGPEVFGFLGTPFTPDANNPPALTGSGAPSHPYRLTTGYRAGTFLDVVQTVEYVAGTDEVTLRYAVTSITGSDVRFRASVSADLYTSGSDSGTGVLRGDAPSREMGGRSGDLEAVLLERSQSPWSAFEENVFFTVFQHVTDPAGFDNTINPDEVDNGAGIQWDQFFGSQGLQEGESTTFEVGWRFGPPPAPPSTPPAEPEPPAGPPILTVNPATAERPGGQSHSVTATLTRPDGSPLSASQLRGAVEGANARSLGSQTTGADGAAQFSYTGLSGGQDTIRVFADLDGNGARGVDEPEAVATVRWMTAAPPEIGETANVEPVRGEVLVAVPEDTVLARRLLRSDAAEVAQSSPGSGFTNFVRIQDVTHVPVGSILETVRGAARLTTARNARGATQMGTFDGGQFRMTQDESSPVVDLSLRGGLSARTACGRRGRGRPSGARPAGEAHSARRVLRRLRGNARGRYRTRGRRSSATVRGTVWSMEERCDGTLTRVRSGVVSVRDFAKRRTITLRRGRSYLARPRARRR
jgi:hypothetical protein